MQVSNIDFQATSKSAKWTREFQTGDYALRISEKGALGIVVNNRTFTLPSKIAALIGNDRVQDFLSHDSVRQFTASKEERQVMRFRQIRETLKASAPSLSDHQLDLFANAQLQQEIK